MTVANMQQNYKVNSTLLLFQMRFHMKFGPKQALNTMMLAKTATVVFLLEGSS